MTKTEAAVQETIESIVRKQLSGTAIEGVVVHQDKDYDGHPIFRVNACL